MCAIPENECWCEPLLSMEIPVSTSLVVKDPIPP
nr:MAG TPA: hypothetical protein [Bacteriophage sp.]